MWMGRSWLTETIGVRTTAPSASVWVETPAVWQLPAATAASILSPCLESAAPCVRVRTNALFGCGLALCCIVLGPETFDASTWTGMFLVMCHYEMCHNHECITFITIASVNSSIVSYSRCKLSSIASFTFGSSTVMVKLQFCLAECYILYYILYMWVLLVLTTNTMLAFYDVSVFWVVARVLLGSC